jgi:hypothetical protein
VAVVAPAPATDGFTLISDSVSENLCNVRAYRLLRTRAVSS